MSGVSLHIKSRLTPCRASHGSPPVSGGRVVFVDFAWLTLPLKKGESRRRRQAVAHKDSLCKVINASAMARNH